MKKLLFFTFIFCILFTQGAWSAETHEIIVQVPEQEGLLTFQHMQDSKLLVSVTDAEKEPIKGLKEDDFNIIKGPKTAQILKVDPLITSKDIGLNIILVVDNSLSMEHREAVQPLLNALEAFYKTLRPIDTVCAVVYDSKSSINLKGKKLPVKILKTNKVDDLRNFITSRMQSKTMTVETYLYDAMMVGLSETQKLPEKANKFMVVFSDGEDLNSKIIPEQLKTEANKIPNFSLYAVDFQPGKKMDPFLKAFSKENSGQIWKAASSSELLPIFKSFSSTLLHRYIVTYRFLNPPTASLAFMPGNVTVEEVSTIDSAPLLNYLFFETGKSELATRYIQLNSDQGTESFIESSLQGAMEKYNNLLNIIGQRMRKNSDAKITIVGCNSNIGEEKGRKDLSISRAESVQSYLQNIWGIDKERMIVESRNLPEVPSTNRIPEGQAENQRVEIKSDHPSILDTVKSEYIEKAADITQIKIIPTVNAEAGINEWSIDLRCGEEIIGNFTGQGKMPYSHTFLIEKEHLDKLAANGAIQADLKLKDNEENIIEKSQAAIMPVKFIQRQERLAQKQGYKVREQYALILFDYNSAAIKARNKVIVDRITSRISALPEADIHIVGHTDNIGKEEYNIQLSQRRAEAVKTQFMQTSAPVAERMHTAGAGPINPLYDNDMPEGRSLNRTVTIALEYEKQ